MSTDAREQFEREVLTHPQIQSDAIILLAGEDALFRAHTAMHLFSTGGGPFLVVSGGRHGPPRHVGAPEVRKYLIGKGVDPERIIVDDGSQNTREQAVAVVAMAVEESWHRIILVASSYHLPRAFLTFVKALQDAGATDAIQIVPMPARTFWGQPPLGCDATRRDLFATEREKIELYTEHVASYEDGLAYLERWGVK